MANLSAKTLNSQGQSIVKIALEVVRISRPIHWVKNLAVFAALIFSGDLFVKAQLARVILAFFAFSFAASASYIFNDIKDAELDRIHPIKKGRPLAAKKLSFTVAASSMVAFVVSSLFIAQLINPLFFLSVLGYLALQASYSLVLKNVAIIDILTIAAGFVIRVYAGAFVIDAHLSVWFLLCVISVALFLASGKRRAELNVLEKVGSITRKSLTRYRRELLNSYVTMFGNAAWMSWALFTFFESPKASISVWLILAELSRATAINKLLMLTTPVVIFGIMRYESLIFEGRSETPEKLLLTDAALISSIIIWTAMVVWILYGGIATYS